MVWIDMDRRRYGNNLVRMCFSRKSMRTMQMLFDLPFSSWTLSAGPRRRNYGRERRPPLIYRFSEHPVLKYPTPASCQNRLSPKRAVGVLRFLEEEFLRSAREPTHFVNKWFCRRAFRDDVCKWLKCHPLWFRFDCCRLILIASRYLS